MSVSIDQIQELILRVVRELGEDLDLEFLNNADLLTPLIGAKSDVDSITLVNIIVDVEEQLAADLELEFVLADEKAMSQRRSPFRNITTLAQYVYQLQEVPSS